MTQPAPHRLSRILLTGYAPWPGQINASQVVVESIRDDLPAALAPFRDRLHCAVLPLSTREIKSAIRALIETHRPDYVVLTGQAPGRNRITLERLATNLRDFAEPDGLGAQPRGVTIEDAGPAAYWSTLPATDSIVERLEQDGIPCAFSNHAGNHLCNQVLYHTLHHAAQSSGPRAGFVHLPILPEQLSRHPQAPFMPLTMLRRALELVVLTLADAN